MKTRILLPTLSAAVFFGALDLGAQGMHDPAERLAAQREAMLALDRLDGVWRGTAWTIMGGGERHEMIQTERVGGFLGGAVKVIEGRGYGPDGSLSFNAFAVVSYDPERRTYRMRSYAMGYTGDYAFSPTPDGFVWEIPMGSATLRYTAVVADGRWREIGERIVDGEPPVRVTELDLVRIGDTDWPSGGAVTP